LDVAVGGVFEKKDPMLLQPYLHWKLHSGGAKRFGHVKGTESAPPLGPAQKLPSIR
jgi:hypothetical protein